MQVAPAGPTTAPVASSPPIVNKCSVCKKNLETILKCSICKAVMYCGQDCQRAAWSTHKITCTPPPQPTNKPPAKPFVLNNSIEMTFEIDGQKYQCFKCIKAVEGVRHLFYTQIFYSIHEIVVKAINKFILNPKTTPLTSKSFVPVDAFVDASFEAYIKEFDDAEFTKKFTAKTGLKRDESVKELDISAKWLKEFYRDPQMQPLFLFTGKDNEKTVIQKCDKICVMSDVFLYRKDQLKECGPAVYPTDFRHSHLQSSNVIPQAVNLSCALFALVTNEKEIELHEFIFAKEEYKQFSWWTKRGYKIVAIPQRGDIAVYFYIDDKKINHVGIYLTDGMIQSKPGVLHDYVYEHPWDAFMGQYGNRIAFLRLTK